jgi:hypothetical protein
MDSFVVGELGQPINISVLSCNKTIKTCSYVNYCFYFTSLAELNDGQRIRLGDVAVFKNGQSESRTCGTE